MTYDDVYIDHVAAIYLASPALNRVAMSFETFLALHSFFDKTPPSSFMHHICRCESPFFSLLPAQIAVQQRLDAAERKSK